jgi:hypothetical protein
MGEVLAYPNAIPVLSTNELLLTSIAFLMTSVHLRLSLSGVYRLEVTGENGRTDHFPDRVVLRT